MGTWELATHFWQHTEQFPVSSHFLPVCFCFFSFSSPFIPTSSNFLQSIGINFPLRDFLLSFYCDGNFNGNFYGNFDGNFHDNFYENFDGILYGNFDGNFDGIFDF